LPTRTNTNRNLFPDAPGSAGRKHGAQVAPGVNGSGHGNGAIWGLRRPEWRPANAAEAAGFDMFVTGDKTLEYGQSMKGRNIAVVEGFQFRTGGSPVHHQ
jgi:hypothetical protein